ncbi:hypothetical protein BH11PLA2_BH11PLA2_26980 [soil metagenome]
MRERELFIAALAEAEDQRLAFLNDACDGDHALHERVAELLGLHNREAAIFQQSPAAIVDAHDDDPTERLRPDPLSVIQDSLTPSQRSDAIGRLNNYEVLAVLGEGAFGIVLKAFDESLHRVVAIKVLHPLLARTSPPRKRFLREARAAAAVKHEHVVQIYALQEEPLPHLVMEFVEGQTLQELMNATGPFEPLEIVRLGRQMALGLVAAHEKGLIHRDIKPANLLLERGPETRIKLSDFGLARTNDAASISQSNVIAGTPLYMAPEQVLGRTLDSRTDLFSLGSVLYAMCVGHPPFRAATTIAVLKRVADYYPRPIREIIPEVPDGLCAIVDKLLAKNPDDRFATSQEVATALGCCLTNPIVSARPLRSKHARRRVLAALAAMMLMGLGLCWAKSRPLANDTVTPVSPAWETIIAGLPVGKQIKAVGTRLKELNPDFDEQDFHCEVREGRVVGVTLIGATKLFDITPLAAFSVLDHLDLRGSGIRSLLAVSTLPVTSLGFDFNAENHAAELLAMPQLKTLNGRAVRDVLAEPMTIVALPETDWLRIVKALKEHDRWPHIIARLRRLNPKWDDTRTPESVKYDGDRVQG